MFKSKNILILKNVIVKYVRKKLNGKINEINLI